MVPCPECGHAVKHTIDGGCQETDCTCCYLHWNSDLHADETGSQNLPDKPWTM